MGQLKAPAVELLAFDRAVEDLENQEIVGRSSCIYTVPEPVAEATPTPLP